MSDLDGTLLGDDILVSAETTQKLNEAIRLGAFFTVATARGASTALELVKNININVPMVLMNGVFIYDAINGNYLNYERIEPEICDIIAAKIKACDADCRMFVFNGEGLDVYSNSVRVFDEIKSTAVPIHKNIMPMEEFDKGIQLGKTVSFVLVKDFDTLSPIYRQIKDMEGISSFFYEDVYSPNTFWLEIYSHGVNKASALEKLRDYGQFDEIVAFGDNMNDIEMLRYADLGCAVANAISAVKKEADRVLSLDNTNDAVANFVLDMVKADG